MNAFTKGYAFVTHSGELSVATTSPTETEAKLATLLQYHDNFLQSRVANLNLIRTSEILSAWAALPEPRGSIRQIELRVRFDA